jgi:lycopene beta-cyclase
MYLLPFSPTRALVEYTLFSADLLPDKEYAVALQTYLKDVLKIPAYTILQEENGVIPMSDQPFSRKIGQHTLAIGTRGGRVKPSSGYAFLRIQQDSRAIVNSLLKHDHPFSIAPSPNRYSLFDSLLLQILYRQGETTPRIFTQMFKNNPPARIFRFLDESGDVYDNLRLIASLPPLPFLKALVRTRLLHKI